MKTLCFVLVCFAVSSNIVAQTSIRSIAEHGGYLRHQASSDNEIGITPYPQSSYLPEVTKRLLDDKASTWLLARVYHTDDPIKGVAKYFQAQGQKMSKPAQANVLLQLLLRDNWQISKNLVRFASAVFGVGSELPTPVSAEKAETSFGVIVLDDSIVRVHLMSPHPSSADNNKLESGTLIILIKERLIQPAEGAAGNESGTDRAKVYSSRDLTRKAQIKSKPEPEYGASGIGATVVLRAVLSASGQVTNIRVVSGPPGGFTEAAVNAARKISFEPAIKDGRFVSQYIQLEYHFRQSP